jgi:hypothetical protein
MHYQEIKPPLGVMPQEIWYEKRINDLLRAISEYSSCGLFGPTHKWTLELADILKLQEHISKSQSSKSNTTEQDKTIDQQTHHKIADLVRNIICSIPKITHEEIANGLLEVERQLRDISQ